MLFVITGQKKISEKLDLWSSIEIHIEAESPEKVIEALNSGKYGTFCFQHLYANILVSVTSTLVDNKSRIIYALVPKA